jgi:AcrR family transcriptional regulator
MDDIARRAAVSKRTLYEFFRDKEDLLVEVLKKSREPLTELFQQLDRNNDTALDIILLFIDSMEDSLQGRCEEFFVDIQRFSAATEVFIEGKLLFLNKVMELLQRGVSEGVFVTDINYDLISFIAHRHISQSDPPEMLRKFSHEEIRNTLTFIFLRGICTEKGRIILDKFITKKKYKQYLKNDVKD